jgi:hypothetical protein
MFECDNLLVDSWDEAGCDTAHQSLVGSEHLLQIRLFCMLLDTLHTFLLSPFPVDTPARKCSYHSTVGHCLRFHLHADPSFPCPVFDPYDAFQTRNLYRALNIFCRVPCHPLVPSIESLLFDNLDMQFERLALCLVLQDHRFLPLVFQMTCRLTVLCVLLQYGDSIVDIFVAR